MKIGLANSIIFLIMSVNVMNCSDGAWDKTYHEQSSFQFEAGKKAIDSLNLLGNEVILDVGCGTGRTTHYCASKLSSGNVWGIDASQSMIDFAKQLYAEHSFLTFEHLNATEMAYDQKFDVVYSLFCLQWIKDQQLVLESIVRSLKRDGRGLLYITCENDLVRRWNKAVEKIKNQEDILNQKRAQYAFFQTPETWITWLENTGATILDYEIIERTKMFNTQHDLKAFLLALNIEPEMSITEREHFLDLVIDELYADYQLTKEDSFNYTTSALVVTFGKY